MTPLQFFVLPVFRAKLGLVRNFSNQKHVP